MDGKDLNGSIVGSQNVEAPQSDRLNDWRAGIACGKLGSVLMSSSGVVSPENSRAVVCWMEGAISPGNQGCVWTWAISRVIFRGAVLARSRLNAVKRLF